jgi:WXG100 family type VII secretion target
MPNELIRANYEKLETIANCFDSQAAEQHELRQRLLACASELRDDGFRGRSAVAFFTEIDGDISPALMKLVEALEASAETTRLVSKLFQAAELEGAGYLNQTASEGRDLYDWLRLIGDGGQFLISLESLMPDEWLEALAKSGKLGDFNKLFKILKIGKAIPGLGVAFGTIFGGLSQLEEEGAHKAFTTAAMEELAEFIPKVGQVYGIVMAVNDVYQGVMALGEGTENWVIDNLISDPDVQGNLRTTADALYRMVDKQDLGEVIDPLFDLIYDYGIGAEYQARNDFAANPSFGNLVKLQAASVSPGFYAALDADYRNEVLQDTVDLVTGTGSVLYSLSIPGTLHFGTLGVLHGSSMAVAQTAELANLLPLPDNAQAWLDNFAEDYTGMTAWAADKLHPGEGIPWIPYL